MNPIASPGSRFYSLLGGGTLSVSWRELRFKEFGPVSRIAAVYQIGPPLAALPFASFKVKVVERSDGSFLGVPNVAVRSQNGSPDWISGLGQTVDEALADTLRFFTKSLDGRTDWGEDSFVWAEPEDF